MVYRHEVDQLGELAERLARYLRLSKRYANGCMPMLRLVATKKGMVEGCSSSRTARSELKAYSFERLTSDRPAARPGRVRRGRGNEISLDITPERPTAN